MKAENNQSGRSGSYGTLLSLFGRKLKSSNEKPVVPAEPAPVEPEVALAPFAQGRRILIAERKRKRRNKEDWDRFLGDVLAGKVPYATVEHKLIGVR